MWPRKYGWLNFAILECSLNVWIVNKIVFAAPELCESALPNPKFLLHCRKWRNINLSWRKFQTSILFHITQNFWVKTYKRDQWNLPNILAYISGIFDGFFKAGLVPLSEKTYFFYNIPESHIESKNDYFKPYIWINIASVILWCDFGVWLGFKGTIPALEKLSNMSELYAKMLEMFYFTYL